MVCLSADGQELPASKTEGYLRGEVTQGKIKKKMAEEQTAWRAAWTEQKLALHSSLAFWTLACLLGLTRESLIEAGAACVCVCVCVFVFVHVCRTQP